MSSDSERKRQRYAEDPVFRAKVLAINKAWHEANKDQVKEARAQRRAENPDAKNPDIKPSKRPHDPAAQRKSMLKCLYGMSTADYDAMMTRQHGTCAICDTRPPEQTLAVDHSHASKRVRGLLCRDCNLGLGNFKDDPRLTRRAADYLEAFLARCAAEAGQAPQTGPPTTTSAGGVSELIDPALEGIVERQRLAIGEGKELHQDHAGDAAGGVEPEIGVVDPAPAQGAGRPLAGDRVGGDLEAQAPLVAAVGDEREVVAARRHRRLQRRKAERADVVFAHQVHDLADRMRAPSNSPPLSSMRVKRM